MAKGGFTYIMANKRRGMIYVGVTVDIAARSWQHATASGSAYCRRWGIDRLVWCAAFDDIRDAIAHEKRIKRWHRAWKDALIEADNPEWDDLRLRLNG